MNKITNDQIKVFGEMPNSSFLKKGATGILEGVTVDLQAITSEGNTSSNAITISGNQNQNVTGNGLLLTYNAGLAQVVGIANNAINTSILMGSSEINLHAPWTGVSTGYRLKLRAQTTTNAGALFQSRVAGQAATQDNEFVTLSQLNSAQTNLTFQNGLRNESDVVKLGANTAYTSGLISEPLWLTTANPSTNNHASVIVGNISNVNTAQLVARSATGTHSFLTITPTNAIFRKTTTNLIQAIDFNVDNNIYLQDALNQKGIQYSANYSANFVDRSLIDKGYLNKFGIGSTSTTGVVTDVNDTLTLENGIYPISNTATNIPTSSSGTLYHFRSGATGYITQQYHAITSADQVRIWARHYMPSTSTWGEWRRLTIQDDIQSVPTLQSITSSGNTSSNAITINGNANQSITQNGLLLTYNAGLSQMVGIVGGAISTSILMGEGEISLHAPYTGSANYKLRLRTQTGTDSGAIFQARVAGQNAVNPNEFVTLSQLGDTSTYLTKTEASATYTPLTRTLTAGNGLTGGGDLSANRTVTLGNPSTLTPLTTNAVTATSHTHSITGFMATTVDANVSTGNGVNVDLNDFQRASIIHSASFVNGPENMVHGFLLNNYYSPSGAYTQLLWEEIPSSNGLWWRMKGGALWEPWYKVASEQWMYQWGNPAFAKSQHVHMLQCLSKGIQKQIAGTALPTSPVTFTANGFTATARFASGAGTNWNWSTPIILVIYWGGTGDADTTIPPNYVTASNNTRIVIVRCVMSDPTGANYGNPNALNTARAIYDYMVQNYTIAGVVMAGHSMGAVGALNCVTRNIIPNVLGIYLTDPVCSLRQRYDFGGTPKQYIEQAYGIAADGSDYDAKTAGYDPMLERADRFKGLYISCVASTGDTTVVYTEHLEKLRAKLANTNNIQATILSSAGHSQQDRFIGTQWQQFMERVVGGTNGLPTVI